MRSIALISLFALAACSGGDAETPDAIAEDGSGSGSGSEVAVAELPAPKCPAATPKASNSLLMVQAWFKMVDKKPKPQPAKMLIWNNGADGWTSSEILDTDSNVFHKAKVWNGGILTIGGMGAVLKHWKKEGDAWTATKLWEKSWGGKFNRLRDVEIGDVNGDGKDEIVLATHDQGVVAVGTEGEDGAWTFVEMDQQADRFVHEVEIGDVDGDGKNEFYVTPSDRNKASMESQPGGVARYDFVDGKYVKSQVVSWDVSHAKEILVADVDGDCQDELYAVREAHTKKKATGKGVDIIDPVKIIRLDKTGDTWGELEVASIDDKQTRFLVPGDVDGDGRTDLIAATYKKGLMVLTIKGDKTFDVEVIDKNSGGFEHATHVADLNGDGKVEIYVAADKQESLNSYSWNGKTFGKAKIADIPEKHITWNLQDGTL